MYGKRRVVLSVKLKPSGRRAVAIKGDKSSIPLGFWYAQDGKLFVDLLPGDLLWTRPVRLDQFNRGLGGVTTKTALRNFVMAYYNDLRKED